MPFAALKEQVTFKSVMGSSCEAIEEGIKTQLCSPIEAITVTKM